MTNKPNIVILFTDDQRFDTIAALGNTEIHTPNMDALAARGAAFTQAHIPGGTSAAVCMPSRAMLHTGRTLFHIEREGQGISKQYTTLGEAFQHAGYRTFGTGKWHNGTGSYARSFTDGGNIFFGGMWDHWNVPMCDFDPTGAYDNQIRFTPNFMHSNQTTKVHCDYYASGGHSSEHLSNAAIDFIQAYDSASPFLMYVSYLAPHDPRSMPQRFKDMYDPAAIRLPANFMDQHPFEYGVSQIRDEKLAAYPREESEIRRHIAEYYAMITHLDEQIGRILAALEQSGKLDNTIIVLAGDNGLAVGQHGLIGKQSHYEHSIRVPLLLSGPGIPAGLRLQQYVYLLDLFPTLCDLSGIAVPASVEGKSLRPLLEDPTRSVRDSLYFAYCDLIRSVKDRRYKLIEYAGAVRTTQLFDLVHDPEERHNLHGLPAYESTVQTLRQDLYRYRDEWEDLGHPLSLSFWADYER